MRFVDDLEPWEARKLWMLNGAHTLLACPGLLRGHRTVAEAIGDPVCRQLVERLWDEDAAVLSSELGLDGYRTALLHRIANSRIEHRLEQIAADSFLKLRLRVAPVAELLLERGERPRLCDGARRVAARVGEGAAATGRRRLGWTARRGRIVYGNRLSKAETSDLLTTYAPSPRICQAVVARLPYKGV